MMDELLTKKELAEKLKVSVKTIDRYTKSGMPHIKMNGSIRFDYEQVKRYFITKGE